MEPDEMHLWALRKQAVEVSKPLSIIFEKSWKFSEVPADWNRGNITSILKREKRKTRGTTGQSNSPLCLARSWSRSSWKLC